MGRSEWHIRVDIFNSGETPGPVFALDTIHLRCQEESTARKYAARLAEALDIAPERMRVWCS